MSKLGPAALVQLERQYSTEPKPELAVREALASDSEVSVKQVNIWFQNRRQR